MGKTRVAVPSRGRASWLLSRRSFTSRALGPETPHLLYIRSDEDPEERELYLEIAEECLCQLPTLRLPPEAGWGETMDAILELAIADDVERLLVVDDDLEFSVRDSYGHPRGTEGALLRDALAVGLALLRPECPHLSVPQVYNRSHDRLLSFCKGMMTVHFLYVPHFRDHPEHRFARGSGMGAYTDFRLSLLELTSGYLNALMTTMCVTNDFNAPGGCSIYRTKERQWAGARELARVFPDSVLLRQRIGWGRDESAVLEKPAVQWKRSFAREKFVAHFGEDPSLVANEMLRETEDGYQQLLGRLRS